MLPVQGNQSINYDAPFEAAKNGDLSKVQAYIQNGGWIDTPDAKGNTMLYYAGKEGKDPTNGEQRLAVAQWLLNKGAHLTINAKGKSLQEKATEEVRALLQNQEAKKHNELITEKAHSYPTHSDSLQFLNSLPPSEATQEALKDILTSAAIAHPEEALTFLTQQKGDKLSSVVSILVDGFLVVGEIKSAQLAVGHLSHFDLLRSTLLSQIEIFTDLLKQAENNIKESPEDFSELVKWGFDLCALRHKEDALQLEDLKEKIIATGSYSEALSYANQLDPESRQIARGGLAYLGLEGYVNEAKARAEAKEAETIEGYWQKFEELGSSADETKNYSEVQDFIRSVCKENAPIAKFFSLGLVLGMCQAQFIEEGYEFLKEINHDGFSEPDVDGVFASIISYLNDNSHTEWATKFSTLRTSSTT